MTKNASEDRGSMVRNLASEFAQTTQPASISQVARSLDFGSKDPSIKVAHFLPSCEKKVLVRWTTFGGMLMHFEELEDDGLRISPISYRNYVFRGMLGSIGSIYESKTHIIKLTDYHSSSRFRKRCKGHRRIQTMPTEVTLQFLAHKLCPDNVLDLEVNIEFNPKDDKHGSIHICMPKVKTWMEMRRALEFNEIFPIALELYLQLRLSLKTLHNHNIFHRDIKVSNLGCRYQTNPTAVLLDWGLGTCNLTQNRGYSFDGATGDSRYLVFPSGVDRYMSSSELTRKRDMAALDVSILVFLCGKDIPKKLDKPIRIARQEMMYQVLKTFQNVVSAQQFLKNLQYRLYYSNAIVSLE